MPDNLASAFAAILAFTPEAFVALGAHLCPEWLVEALAAGRCGEKYATMRKRKLPVERAIWLVIGMALFRDRSIEAVAEHLSLALPRPGPRDGVARSALSQARARLGAEPVRHLFDLTAQEWGMAAAEKETWRELRLFGMDGSCLRIADTLENEAAFGRPGSGRSGSGYPQVRFVALMALRSHILAGLSLGGYHEGEGSLVKPLWDRLPNKSLTLLDRNFLSWWPLWRLHETGEDRHWLLRLKSNVKYQVIRALGPGDDLVEITVNSALRREHPEMPATFQTRVVTYQVKGYRPQKLMTSMLDAEQYPAKEIGALYHERWEIELGYDELKTHMLEREESLRSKNPEGVRQEIAGMALAYNLVRREMERVAHQLGIPPRRMSFRNALLSIRNFCLWAWSTAPGALPKLLGSLESELRLLVLPDRRSERRYPRHVKIKMSNYPRNRGKSASRA